MNLPLKEKNIMLKIIYLGLEDQPTGCSTGCRGSNALVDSSGLDIVLNIR
jgi:hypothetical protein